MLLACTRPGQVVSTQPVRPDRPEREREKTCCAALRTLADRKDSLAGPFLTAGLLDRSAEVRICALEYIAPTLDSRAISRIRTLLNDPVQEVRLAAVIALKRSALFLPLCDLLTDADPDVVAAAEYALGSSPDSLVSRRLASQLRDPRQPASVRSSCARVLEQLHDPKTLPALRASLGDLNDTVRVAVLHALPQFGEFAAAPLLLGALDGQRPATRIAAAQGLGRLAGRRTPLGRPGVTARLVSMLNDKNNDVVLAAVRALGMIRDPAAAEPLARLVRRPRTISQASVIRALARIGEPGLGAIEDLLRDDRPELRTAGIAACELIRSDQAVNRLADALPDWECGTRAAEALDHRRWKPGDDAQLVHYLIARRDNFGLFEQATIAGPVLRNDLESGNRLQVENAAITLVALGTTEAVPKLIEVLRQYGNELLASAYVNSGLDTLVRAGQDWAAHHGYVLIRGGDTTGVRWAGWR